MDPLSPVASIIAILQLTESVLTSCYRFVGKVNSAAADVDRIIRETGSLKVILLDLQRLADEGGGSHLSNSNLLTGEGGPLTACFNSLKELETKLSPAAGPMSIRRRLLWQFESKKVDQILDSLQNQKPTLLLAFLGANTDSTLAIDNRVASIQESLEAIQLRERREKILNWLLWNDPKEKHSDSRRLHQPGSNHWILESNLFKSWKTTPNQALWVNGIPGAGKTVICSTIIDHMEEFCKSIPTSRLAYYYFDFNDKRNQKLAALLRSLILQLSRQREVLSEHVESLYEQCDNGRSDPGDKLLASVFFSLLCEPGRSFVIIDALDECPSAESCERDKFYELVTSEIGQRPGLYNFLMTSRKEWDIEEAMTRVGEKVVLHNLSIQNASVDADVRLHVRQVIVGNKKLRNWSEVIRREIEESIVGGAQGMFRWAVCQLETIKKCIQPSAIRKFLSQLPKTLEETYDRILESIPEENKITARAALMLLAFSSRPITLQELAEAIVVDTENKSFGIDERLNDPLDVLEICSSLVTVSKTTEDGDEWMQEKRNIERIFGTRTEEAVIRFAHFSVKEYIVSQRLMRGSPLSTFYFSAAAAHRYISEASLLYLLDFNKGDRVVQFDFKASPFLAYAARYWHEHWRAVPHSDDQASMKVLMQRLFSSDKTNSYINWLNICNPDVFNSSSGFYSLGFSRGKSVDAFPQPLYYAANFGLYELSEWLLENGCDVNSSRGEFGQPLQAAAFSGNEEIVKLLLDHGADVNAQGGEYGNALQAAGYAGYAGVVELLLDCGADINAQGGRFGSALIAAALKANSNVANLLLERGADIDILSEHQGKALHAASAAGNADLVSLLLQKGADINDRNGSAGSALYAASESGAIEIVRMLLKADADINLKSGYNSTALQTACSKGHVEVVRLLLASGADSNIQGGNYGDALQACVEDRNPEILQMLLDHGADINHQGGIYHSALRAGLYTGNIAAAKTLLDRGATFDDGVFLVAIENERSPIIPELLRLGANCNAQNKEGSALQLAIEKNDLETTLMLLQSKGIDVNCKGGEHGGNPLHSAVYKGNEKIVLELLDRGAAINTEGGDYNHCLGAAAIGGHEQLVRLLLDRGANVDGNGGYYGGPLIRAVSQGHENIVRLLLDHGADINASGAQKGDALQAASYEGNENLVKLLLERGADIKSPEGEHGSCLECAIISENDNLARFLLENGANVNCSLDPETVSKGGHGFGGALISAIRCRRNELIPLLLDHGADVNALGEKHYGTALQTAARWGNEESVRLLLSRGADVNKIGGYYGSALADVVEVGGRKNGPKIIQMLLDAGADVNLQAGYYGCPLSAAVHTGTVALVEQLLDRGAEVNAPAGAFGSILQNAVIEGDLDIFRLLIRRGANVNTLGGYNGSALGAAARYGYETMVRGLLEYGADASAGESHALWFAARRGLEPIVSLLLDAGADLHSQKGVPGNALKEAASGGYEHICRLLLDRGADVNALGGEYGNALQASLSDFQTARANKVAPVVRLLLDRGADVNLPPSEKYTSALQAAICNGNDKFVATLLDSGVDINANDPRFGTAITAAARYANARSVKYLLDRGADPHLVGGKYGTALQASSFEHEVEIMELLLDLGVNVNEKAGKYGYALHAACHTGPAVQAVELLLARGADINARGGKYETALQCAARHGHLETIKLLLKNGADPTMEGGKHGNAVKAAMVKEHYHVANALERHIAKTDSKD